MSRAAAAAALALTLPPAREAGQRSSAGPRELVKTTTASMRL
jgi:hypothetical protein